MRANYLRSHAYPLWPLLFPPRAYVGHVFRRYTFEDIDRRVSPSVAVAAATLPAGNYSYSLFGPRRASNKNLPARCKTTGRSEGDARFCREYHVTPRNGDGSSRAWCTRACCTQYRDPGIVVTRKLRLRLYTSYHLTPFRTLRGSVPSVEARRLLSFSTLYKLLSRRLFYVEAWTLPSKKYI